MNYWNRVYHLYKSVPFTEKQPRRPETDTKNGFEDFPLVYYVRKNRATFSDVRLLPEIFRRNEPKSSNPFTTFQQNFRETFLPPQGFRPEGEIPRRHSSNSRVY